MDRQKILTENNLSYIFFNNKTLYNIYSDTVTNLFCRRREKFSHDLYAMYLVTFLFIDKCRKYTLSKLDFLSFKGLKAAQL